MCNTGDELTDLRAAAERLRNRPRSDRAPDEVASDLVRLRHICDLLELEFSEEAARPQGRGR